MKILIALFLVVLTLACEEIGTDIITPGQNKFEVEYFDRIDTLVYSPQDSLLTTIITFKNAEAVKEVWAKIYTLDGTETIFNYYSLEDITSQIAGPANLRYFRGIIPFSKQYDKTFYIIDYFVKDTKDENHKAASQKFWYDNTAVNYPPVISNLVIPSSIDPNTPFTVTLRAEDQNSLNDISQVYFYSYKPDGSAVDPGTGLSYFLMNDSGQSGDAVAGDGIFSYPISFGSSQPKGTWRFVFRAKDKSNVLSNEIIHNLVLN